MVNGRNVLGTLSPGATSSNEEPAWNNKLNCPRRTKPTSPILMGLLSAETGSLEVVGSNLQSSSVKTATYHRASLMRQRESISLREKASDIRGWHAKDGFKGSNAYSLYSCHGGRCSRAMRRWGEWGGGSAKSARTSWFMSTPINEINKRLG